MYNQEVNEQSFKHKGGKEGEVINIYSVNISLHASPHNNATIKCMVG